MPADLTLALAIVIAIAFGMTNGFLDAANAIATLVATRAASPLAAIVLASVFNLLGPLFVGAAVADTIGTMVTVGPGHAVAVIGAGLSGAVLWNLVAWRRSLPSSSSHALVGGLVGAALLDSGVNAITWGPIEAGRVSGVFGVLLGILVATTAGLLVSLALERLALRAMRRATTRFRSPIRTAQLVTSAWLAFSHGSNDAQKSVGVIAALLLASGHATTLHASTWLIAGCALAVTVGTALGGWTIVRTIGRRLFPVRSLDGLVSQTSSAGVIFASSLLGVPVSTTQVVATTVVGIGIGRRRWRHVGWNIVGDIGLAWITTMPAAGIIGAVMLPFWKMLGGAGG